MRRSEKLISEMSFSTAGLQKEPAGSFADEPSWNRVRFSSSLVPDRLACIRRHSNDDL